MTKASETGIYALTILTIYIALVFGVIPLPTIVHDEIVPVLPWWGLVSFGCYTLYSLGYGVYTLQDKEDKYEELLGEIKEAREYLSENGITTSSK